MGGPGYTLIFAPITKEHLRRIERKYHAFIQRTIHERLKFEPGAENRNRKPLRQPAAFGAEWEIRFGGFRALYKIEDDARVVRVLAIGKKDRDQLVVGDEEIEL